MLSGFSSHSQISSFSLKDSSVVFSISTAPKDVHYHQVISVFFLVNQTGRASSTSCCKLLSPFPHSFCAFFFCCCFNVLASSAGTNILTGCQDHHCRGDIILFLYKLKDHFNSSCHSIMLRCIHNTLTRNPPSGLFQVYELHTLTPRTGLLGTLVVRPCFRQAYLQLQFT